jgi:predicted amino acid racemase
MYPQLTIDVDLIANNTRSIAENLLAGGVELIGVTKVIDGDPAVGQAMLDAGCAGLADSRLPSLVKLAAHALAPLTLIRAPYPDEVETAAQLVDRVLVSDVAVAKALGQYAPGYPIELLLTVDLGDRREGVLPEDAVAVARQLADLPGTLLAGVAVNFACLSGLQPSQELFRQGEAVLDSVAGLCTADPVLSLGGTCVLPHLKDYRPRVRTEARAGAGPVFGSDLVSSAPLEGLQPTPPILEAAVLESYRKPPPPAGPRGGDCFGHEPETDFPDGDAVYTMIALGRRDSAPSCLSPLDPGVHVVGMTSDVAVLLTERIYTPGETVRFALDYEGLVRAMTSPYVSRRFMKRAACCSAETP